LGSVNYSLTLEEMRALAEFWSDEGQALSVYFQPPIPSDLAHREDLILAKDTLRHKLTSLQGSGRADRADIERVLDTVAELKGNPRRSKVIFACARHKFWREYDVRADFGVRVHVAQGFSIAPLIAEQQGRRRYCIALADRNKARLLLLESREISEHSQVLDEEKEPIRTTGASKSGHLERKKEEKVRQHFAFVAEHLLHFHEHGDYDGLLVGCRDEMWPEIESALHPEIRRILVGRFPIDPGSATCDEISAKAQAIVDENDKRDEIELVDKVVGGAASGGMGAVGLRAVIEALEQGEVRTLLWTPAQDARKVTDEIPTPEAASLLCPNCMHLDSEPATGLARVCTLCGSQMRQFAQPEEAFLRHAVGRSIELRRIMQAKLPPPHQIAARLRFLARHNTAQALAS
jgi:peptide subunit release factor 1 (eRF1)